MTTWYFDSTQTGLTGITGQVGTLANILDIILSGAGFNSSNTGWTATWSGGLMTLSKTGHGYPIGQFGLVLSVTGASPSGYNIVAQNCTVVDANTITTPVVSNPGSSPATGTLTVFRPSLGWTTAFTGTNLRSYRQKTGTNQFYLGVDDTGTNVARVRAFEIMTAAGVAVGSGTNPFPNDTQLAGGAYVTKSSAADATSRPWSCYSDGKIFHFFIQFSSAATTGNGFRFGDFYSRKTGDIYNTLLNADPTSAATSTSIRVCGLVGSMSTMTGLWVARPYTGTAGGITAGFITDYVRNSGTTEMGSGGANYPHPIEGGIVVAPIWVSEGSVANGARGTLPGCWNICHSRPLNHGDTFSGVGGTSLANKTFHVFNAGSAAQCCHETSDTWTAPI